MKGNGMLYSMLTGHAIHSYSGIRVETITKQSTAEDGDFMLKTKVVSCEPADLKIVVNGKKTKLSAFEVVLEDTVLFPEGGGQPDDRGTINGHEVLQVIRRGGHAIHYLPVPLDLETEADLKVNWERRWDHMQQHSGQHLVTAIADEVFGFKTTSWYLGEKTSFIELDTPAMSPEQRVTLEQLVNKKILSGVRMFPTLYTGVDDPTLKQVRTRGLPEDHMGPVRVVTIDTIESNMCCGTHVSTLSHLQSIKLLGIEKGKKGKTNLVFVAGQRVLDYLGKAYDTEKALTGLLKGGPDLHVELLTKVQNSYKVAQKNTTSLLRDVAVLEGQKFKNTTDRPPYFFLHRREGDNEFMNIVVNEIADESVVILLTTGDDKGAGLFLLAGKQELIAEIGPKVAELIEGKGAAKKGRYQGKANRLSKKVHAESLIMEHLGVGTSQQA